MKDTLEAALALTASPAPAKTDLITRSKALSVSMTCEIDPDNIAVQEAGGFDPDDVIRGDGQYSMTSNAAFSVRRKRKR